MAEAATAAVGKSGELVDPNPKNRFEGEESVSTRPGDLFWDQLIKYAASGMLILAAFDIVSSFTSDGVKCLTPDSYTRDQSAFINSYCSEHTPTTDYFLFYLLAQAILIAGPQLFWQWWFSGRLSFFVALASSLDRHRDSKTGEFASENFVIAKQLLNAFHRKRYMVFFYFMKLILQLFIILAAAGISSGFFTDYNTIFSCPRQWDITTNRTWPLPSELNCSYSVLRSYQAAWITNYVLLALALACTVYGLGWCLVSHGSKLNWMEAARFALESGISQNYYHSRGFLHELRRCQISLDYHIKNDLDFLLLKLFPQDVGRANVLRELLMGTFVRKELDAILQRLNLLRESEKGTVPNEELKSSIMDSSLSVSIPERKKAKKDLGDTMTKFFVNVATAEEIGVEVEHAGMVDTGEVNPELPRGRRKIQGASINLSFGSLGYTHFLAQFSGRVLSLDFHPHLVNHKKPVHYQHFHSEVHSVTVMSNIYALPVEFRNKLDEALTSNNILNKPKPEGADPKKPPERIPVRLIVISPFTNPDRIITINWFLYLMKRIPYGCHKDIRLITFTPLRVGHSKVKFVEFKPTSPWETCEVEFKHDTEVESDRQEVPATMCGGECCVSLEGCQSQRKPKSNYYIKTYGAQPKGEEKDESKNTVVLQCGGIQCTFKVMVYRIKWQHEERTSCGMF